MLRVALDGGFIGIFWGGYFHHEGYPSLNFPMNHQRLRSVLRGVRLDLRFNGRVNYTFGLRVAGLSTILILDEGSNGAALIILIGPEVLKVFNAPLCQLNLWCTLIEGLMHWGMMKGIVRAKGKGFRR